MDAAVEAVPILTTPDVSAYKTVPPEPTWNVPPAATTLALPKVATPAAVKSVRIPKLPPIVAPIPVVSNRIDPP